MDLVGKEVMWQLGDLAEVEAVVGAGKTAKVDHQRVFRADVMVHSDDPAAVVGSRDCIKVCSDPFKVLVASLLVDCRVGVPIEGKGDHLLADATLPRVS